MGININNGRYCAIRWIEFLSARILSLEVFEGSNNSISPLWFNDAKKRDLGRDKQSCLLNNSQSQQSSEVCSLCNGQYKLFGCPQFKAMSTYEQHLRVKGLWLCFNCFSHKHGVKEVIILFFILINPSWIIQVILTIHLIKLQMLTFMYEILQSVAWIQAMKLQSFQLPYSMVY